MAAKEELADLDPESRPANTDAATAQPQPVPPVTEAAAAQPSPTDDLEAFMKKLLELLVSFPNRSLAIEAALKAVRLLQQGQEEEVPKGSQISAAAQNSSGELPMRAQSAGADSDHSPSWEATSAPDAEAGGSRRSDGAASESRPERRELASVIDEYPNCKRLMEAYRRVYHMPNKTPLSILFEYASRYNLQLSFEEGQTSQGQFTLTLQLRNERAACLYRPGIGQAKSKKDAKQLAAAALLEVMLDHVAFQELLYKSDKQQQQSFKDLQAQRSHSHAIPKGRGNRLVQRHSGGVLPYRGFPGVPQLHSMSGPLPTGHFYPSSQGLPGSYGALPGMGQGMHVPGAGQMPQTGPFDMGYGQDQQRLLLARAGSDPTLGFANIPRDAAAGSHGLGLNLQEHQMQQGLLCNDMGLPSMGQQPGHGQLPYGDTGLDPSLGASMANLGLQGSLMDSLQGSHWQDCMMHGDLVANTMPAESTTAPLGLPTQHQNPSQGMAPLPAGAFNLPWLPDNSMH